MKKHDDDACRIRDAVVGGIFYSDTKTELESELKSLFIEAAVPAGKAFAVVSPHAGFNYSGIFSAASFLSAAGRAVSRVVILAPVHHDPAEGVFLPESDLFATPLGDIAVDQDIVSELEASSPLLTINDIPHLEEHCVEVQLPFIRYLFPEASIVPILIGRNTASGVKALASSLSRVLGKSYDQTLFVVSSNLTSYKDFETGRSEADIFLELITRRDVGGMIEAKHRETISACGVLGIATLLSLDGLDLAVNVIRRGDSSEGNGDRKNGVHYASIVFETGNTQG